MFGYFSEENKTRRLLTKDIKKMEDLMLKNLEGMSEAEIEKSLTSHFIGSMQELKLALDGAESIKSENELAYSDLVSIRDRFMKIQKRKKRSMLDNDVLFYLISAAEELRACFISRYNIVIRPEVAKTIDNVRTAATEFKKELAA